MISFSAQSKAGHDASIILLLKSQKHPLLKKDLDAGEVFLVVDRKVLICFVGLGDEKDLTQTTLRAFIRRALLTPAIKKLKTVELQLHKTDEATVNVAIEGVMIGSYVWDKYKSKKAGDLKSGEQKVTIIAVEKPSYRARIQICEGVNLTRDLVNDNADTVTSEFLHNTVKSLIKGRKNISLDVLNRKELKARGLNLHLAVNQGSLKEPKLIIVKYAGGSKSEGYTALIGKGMTFDTGGLNLKPTGGIETMKIDMAGAAAVIGVLKNTISLNIKKNLLFVLGVAENAIGSAAYKPGDVITGYAGKSVEIGNTDAEGRLVLADAFAYVVKNYKPAQMIDLATLTGACVVALGFDYTGLFSNTDSMAKDLLAAAEKTDDRAWHMPVYAELKEYIKSPIADLKNTSSIKGAGACTAAQFLNSFTENTPWAHLDIAGSSYAEGAGRMYFSYGATGAGVRLLTEYFLTK